MSLKALEKELGFANGSIAKTDEKTQSGRIKAIADYFGVSMEYILTGESGQKYYFDDETAAAAQELFEDPDLRALMSAGRGCKPEQIRLAAEMLREYKRTNPDG